MYRLVIVESPTKARTLSRFLSDEFVIEASVGHVRDLPQSATDIPARYKKLPWARLGINVEEAFAPLYIIPKDKKETVKKLKEQVKGASEIYLATDDDREGESICWHLLEILKPTIPTYRMVFHEITQQAITQALQDCRAVDMKLVKAQETRRILDRLFGYTLSPLIWKKIAYGLSAGRVQSPALHMIVTREWERIKFHPHDYWDIVATIASETDFSARLIQVAENTVAKSKDFDSTTGTYLGKKGTVWLQQEETERLVEKLSSAEWKVTKLNEKPSSHSPPPPFITSTLQQTANRQFGWNVRQTMRVAQRLYEMGHITYMRTDSTALSQEALRGMRKIIQEKYGAEYLPEKTRHYWSRTPQVQGAHEAIRPSGESFAPIHSVGTAGSQERRLYQLIYHRALASQMSNAQKKTYSIRIQAENCTFSAAHTIITFPGFLILYQSEQTSEKALQFHTLTVGTILHPEKILPDRHATKPPARYNEASLIQSLEEKGIGRPSTYASIISTLFDRHYIIRKDNTLIPTFTGVAVSHLMKKHFHSLIDYQFTADMESILDNIAKGDEDSLKYLTSFYLDKEAGLKNRVAMEEDKINPKESRMIRPPHLQHTIQISRYGAYIDHEDNVKVNLSEESAPADLTDEFINGIAADLKKSPEVLGVDPTTKKNIYIKSGRYGFYLQLGELETESREKPRTARLTMPPEKVSLEEALKLLALPRNLGDHPETGEPITANLGRFGPYLGYQGEYRSIKEPDDVYTIALTRAVEILKTPKKTRGGKFARKKPTDSSRKTP